jgi:iron(III) transport system substrate-binding protein
MRIIDNLRGLAGRIFFALLMIMLPAVSASLGADVSAEASKAPWQERWENTVAAARKEGKITIYGQVGPELRVALTSVLKEELGLELDLLPGKGIEVATRFLTELRAGSPSADIMLGGASTLRGIPEAYAAWDKLEPALILPEVLDPKAWPNGKLPFLDGQEKLIPLVLQAAQLCWVNTEAVKSDQIKAYRDLLEPQWKGKIVMADPTTPGPAQDWIKLILMKAYGLTEGEAFLRKFVAREPALTRDSRQQIEWVARGRYPVCIGIDEQAAYNMHKSGAPITRLAAEEGNFLAGGGSYLGMSLKRPHPHAAVVVVNWLLSARGQEVYSNAFGGPSSRRGVQTKGVSAMAYPFPGEKLFMVDEEFVTFTPTSLEVAKRVFAPLMK